MSVNDAVRKSIDDAFSDGIKGLVGAAIAKVTGGEPIDEAMKQYDAGIVIEVTKLHTRILEETGKTLNDLETFQP